MYNKGKMNIKKSDLILIAILLLIAFATIIVLSVSKTTGAMAVVKINNQVVGEYPLKKDTTVKFGDDDKYNILTIENNSAKISEASCPDQLCVHQKKISYDSQSIICLPNKVVVEIISDEACQTDVVAN